MSLVLSFGLLTFCLVLAALPLVRRLTPVEPSPFKLLLYSALLSPALCALVHGLIRIFSEGPVSRWGTLGLLGLGFLLPQPRPIRRAPLGRAAWGAIGLALLAAGGLAQLLFNAEGAMRLGHDGLGWQVALARFLLEGGALEQPMLAGAALECSPVSALIVASLSALSGLGSAWIFAALACWSCALVLLCLHLWSAALWRSEVADLGVLFLALFGWGSWAFWDLLPGVGGGWAVALARVTGGDPGAILHSGMAWIRGGPGVLALALGMGGLYGGSHALRHGKAPWPLLAGICLGLCVGVHPLFGMALVGAHCLTLLLAPRWGGPRGADQGRALVEFLLPVVPGFLVAWKFSLGLTPHRVLTPEVSSAALTPGIGLGVLALMGVWLGWRDRSPRDAAQSPLASTLDRRILLVHLLLAGGCLLGFGFLADGTHRDHALFFRGAGLVLAVLSAGCFKFGVTARVKPYSWTCLPPLVGCAFALLLILSGLRVAQWTGTVHERLKAVALAEPQGHLRHRGLSPRSRALQALRDHDLAPGTVLALRTDVPAERLPPEPGVSVAGVTAGLALLVDLDRGPRQAKRLERLKEVLLGRMNPGAHLAAFLMVPGRDVLVLVDEVDREASAPGFAPRGPRGVDRALESAGLSRVVDLDGCAVYLWRQK